MEFGLEPYAYRLGASRQPLLQYWRILRKKLLYLLIHVCDMTHSYVWHNAFMCVTWLVRVRDMTHFEMNCWNVWHNIIVCAMWHIHMHDSFHVWTSDAVTVSFHTLTGGKSLSQVFLRQFSAKYSITQRVRENGREMWREQERKKDWKIKTERERKWERGKERERYTKREKENFETLLL